MKTDDLIRAIVADNTHLEPPVTRTLAAFTLAGAAAAALLFAVLLGLRSDFFWSILHSPRFIFKFVFTLAIAVPAFLLVRRLTRPDAEPGRLTWLLMLPFVMLAIAVAAEMYAVPRDHWPVYAVGSNALVCMATIPMLSAAPLAAILYALKSGAPARPPVAGAIAGLLASAIGATLYASHCADDSPLFVSIWYPAAIVMVTAAGAMIGARLLKW